MFRSCLLWSLDLLWSDNYETGVWGSEILPLLYVKTTTLVDQTLWHNNWDRLIMWLGRRKEECKSFIRNLYRGVVRDPVSNFDLPSWTSVSGTGVPRRSNSPLQKISESYPDPTVRDFFLFLFSPPFPDQYVRGKKIFKEDSFFFLHNKSTFLHETSQQKK